MRARFAEIARVCASPQCAALTAADDVAAFARALHHPRECPLSFPTRASSAQP